ncbi:MAG TPA: hypothetical protein VFG04_16955 [Planctomycetaceae bacterium]|jgi:hypothetical protein|nr:hypothetical protein [Planctomycetaceae bacterium]
MNFRVFLLIGAMGVFGALWSSDGRYQTKQIEMARAERARTTNANAVFIARIEREVAALSDQFAIKLKEAARASVSTTAVAPATVAPIAKTNSEAIAPDALLGRLIVAWVFNLDPGNGMGRVTGQVTLAKARLDERLCLLRFQTRQMAFFASRRAAVFLHSQLAAAQQPDRMARIIIREIPIEETRAPAAGGRQTR